MFISFFKFFISYLFKAKTRQRLLIMALSSLIISSFSLLAVQSVLKGLQNNRIDRGKMTLGHFVVNVDEKSSNEALEYVKSENIPYSLEYELEGLLRLEGYLAPVIFHGVSGEFGNTLPAAIESWPERDELLLSPYLARKVYSALEDKVQLISPAHTDLFFGDLPRFKTLQINRFTDSKDPDIDEVHAWGHVYSAFSILKKKKFNKLRIFSTLTEKQLSDLETRFSGKVDSWEKLNSNLVYALKLENNVVLFLFLATILLVTFSIISGLSIFYARVRNDFASFWILGMSISAIKRYGGANISIITIIAIAIGNALSFIVLSLLTKFSPVIMPAMFVDRSLPVKFEASSFIYSFVIPAVITLVFTAFSNWRFFKDNSNFIGFVKKVGV